MKNKTVWANRLKGKTSLSFQKIGSSIGVDKRLYEQDIAASIIHAKMLVKQKIISSKDGSKIINGLKKIKSQIDRGKFKFQEKFEDIHLNIEKKQKLQLIHNACENDMERDAIYSLSIGEDTQSFADRHGLEYNTATQFKRRLKEKLKNRLNINSDQSTSNQENNHG